MPELPEVQTVLDTLELQIADKKIIDVKIFCPKIVACDQDLFKDVLIGQCFRSFRRRGKYLIFEMDDMALVVHLRMEGKFFLQDPEVPYDKHDHVVFDLDDGRQLRYNDVRKFGRMELMELKEDYSDFKDLGPEPFCDDFSEKYCTDFLKNRRRPIKEVLLDQSFVAGIGNIYADEILFRCKIDPRTPADHLDQDDVGMLIRVSRDVLSEACREGGTTIRSYTSSLGVTGRFQFSLRAHGQKRCPVCETQIRKIRVGGRGTYFCENCQELK